MIGLLKQRALAGSELWILSSCYRNTAILDQNRSRPLDEIRQESRKMYADLLEALEVVEDDAVNHAAWFREMPAERIPWKLIADNSSDHYLQHAQDIRKWIETR